MVRRLLPAVVVLSALVAAALGSRWLIHRLRYVSTDDAQIRGDLVLVAPRHPGTLLEVAVREGQSVARGEVIARLDARSEQIEEERARAALQRAEAEHARAVAELTLTRAQVRGRRDAAAAGVTQSREGLEQAREDLRLQEERARRGIEHAGAALRAARARAARAVVEEEDAAREAARIGALFAQGVVAESQRDRTVTLHAETRQRTREASEEEAAVAASLETARAELLAVEIKRRQEKIADATLARARVEETLAGEEQVRVEVQQRGLKVLEAALRQAEAAHRGALVRLEECTLTSPIDGVVARRIADAGETLAPGQPVAALNDPGQIWVEANIKETALRRVAPGAEVTVRVDALPRREFRGTVATVNAAANSQYALLPSGNPSGQFIKVTQRVAVRIDLLEKDPLLRPGMMVVVDIRAR